MAEHATRSDAARRHNPSRLLRPVDRATESQGVGNAQRPAANNNWISTGPHVMAVGANGMMGYSRDAKPDTAKPYDMWAGTPYEHVMLPVR
jgi:hypothetical protein